MSYAIANHHHVGRAVRHFEHRFVAGTPVVLVALLCDGLEDEVAIHLVKHRTDFFLVLICQMPHAEIVRVRAVYRLVEAEEELFVRQQVNFRHTGFAQRRVGLVELTVRIGVCVAVFVARRLAGISGVSHQQNRCGAVPANFLHAGNHQLGYVFASSHVWHAIYHEGVGIDFGYRVEDFRLQFSASRESQRNCRVHHLASQHVNPHHSGPRSATSVRYACAVEHDGLLASDWQKCQFLALRHAYLEPFCLYVRRQEEFELVAVAFVHFAVREIGEGNEDCVALRVFSAAPEFRPVLVGGVEVHAAAARERPVERLPRADTSGVAHRNLGR